MPLNKERKNSALFSNGIQWDSFDATGKSFCFGFYAISSCFVDKEVWIEKKIKLTRKTFHKQL